ncbi:EamA family transporter [Bacillus sp. C11]|nr:EamA family transporter [Neobacillus terrae]
MGASLIILPFSLLNLPKSLSAITPIVSLSVMGVALLSTAMGYLVYYYLIKNIGPTKTVSVTYMIPLFGMVWGVLFLKEQITIGSIKTEPSNTRFCFLLQLLPHGVPKIIL